MQMRLSVVLLLLATLTACQTATDDFELGPTDADVSGTFSLTSINGGGLPIIARLTTTDRWDLSADTLRISSDSTWTETSFYNVTSLADGSVTKSQSIASGVYVITDKQINFTMRVGGTATFIGAVQTNVLTLVFNDAHFVYVR
jgi:hypothetical protein